MHIHNNNLSDPAINNNSSHYLCQKAFLNSRLHSHILRGYFVNGKRKYVKCKDAPIRRPLVPFIDQHILCRHIHNISARFHLLKKSYKT